MNHRPQRRCLVIVGRPAVGSGRTRRIGSARRNRGPTEPCQPAGWRRLLNSPGAAAIIGPIRGTPVSANTRRRLIMKSAVSSFLVLAVLALTVVTASSPTVKPEEVGLSSERLQRISQMIQRRIAAGDVAGAVTVVARKGKVAHLFRAGCDGPGIEAADHAGEHVPDRIDDQAGRRRGDHDDGRRRQAAAERSDLALHP